MSAIRRGSGICPHAQFKNLNIAEVSSLGKASEGKRRELKAIPKGYRLDCTGVKVDSLAFTATSGLQCRGIVCTAQKSGDGKTKRKNEIELKKRSNPSWSGVHVRFEDGDVLMVQIQTRVGEDDLWKDAFPIVIIEPLAAFNIEGQDIVWHNQTLWNGSITVLVELSLQRLAGDIHQLSHGTGVAAKIRQKKKIRFEPRKRSQEEIASDNAMLQELLDNPDPTTPQNRVSMKDIWNKCLGWIDLTGEFIVEGLFLRCPELLDIMGNLTAELAFDMFISLIDKAIRVLDESTEVIARESYHTVPLNCARRGDAPFETLEEGFQQFAQLGMRPHHWKEARAIFLLAMMKAVPYLEDPDKEILEEGKDSCAYRFWTYHIMKPAMLAIKDIDDLFEDEKNRVLLHNSFASLAKEKQRSGTIFYQNLFKLHPELIPYFGRTDMDSLAGHLFEAIDFLCESFNDFQSALPMLQNLAKIHDKLAIPTSAYSALGNMIDITMRETVVGYADGTPEGYHLLSLWSAVMNRSVFVMSRISFHSERLLRRAFEWIDQMALELAWDDAYLAKRKIDIEAEVRTRGTYTHTEEEVVHGARVAWRNSAKCIGRIAWNTLLVRDRRHVTELDNMFAECLEHQRLATADGSLKSVMTVFRPRQPGTRLGMRFWNAQLIRFACYELPDGILMGDRANKVYTDECIAFGWKPPEPRSEFDVLPVIIEDPDSRVTKMFEVPKEYHKVTMLEHPKFPEFADLKLRWCVVPTVTSFTLVLGGLQYTCCPFNGWFMEAEIMRDLLEPNRMDKMIAIARAIGVDHEDESDYWRERVAIETNKAIMHSFRRDGHSIVDHVTAQAQYLAHDLREKREGRECPAQWSWVVPSFGGSTLPIWHHEMRDFYIEPAYTYQVEIYAVRKESKIEETELVSKEDEGQSMFEEILIIYASVTGTAESYAYRAKKLLHPLRVTVMNCKQIEPSRILEKSVALGGQFAAVLFITSTFGEGVPPPTAEIFFNKLKSFSNVAMAGLPYSVMAIGSTVYPDFCQAGVDLDRALQRAGGAPLLPLQKADEVNEQERSVLRWISMIGALFNLEQKKALVLGGNVPGAEEDDGPPVSVELLTEEDSRVKTVLEEEENLAKAVSSYTEAEAITSVGAIARFLPEGYKLCAVTRNSELVQVTTPEEMSKHRSTRFLEFDLDGVAKEGSNQALVYETGDHARVLPSNDPSVVAAMCRCLQLEPNQWVDVHIQEGSGPKLSTSPVRVGNMFSLEIDLATQDGDGNLRLFSRLLQIARSIVNQYSSGMDDAGSLSNEDLTAVKAELSVIEQIVENLTDSGDAATSHDLHAKHDKAANAMTKELLSASSVKNLGGVGGIGMREASQRSLEPGPPHRRGQMERIKSAVFDKPADSLVRRKSRKEAITHITETFLDVTEILHKFPLTTTKLTLADCVEVLPRLKPRYYSIASAAEVYPSSLQLTVGVLTVTHKSTNKKRQGVCSHFLARATTTPGHSNTYAPTTTLISSEGTSYVRLGVISSKFRLPADMEAPLIMVGPGTGISPMLGFLQAREKAHADGHQLGQCIVFFGCRSEEDFLHRSQMKKWAETGIITNLQVTFSRIAGKPKEYVQHRIRKIHKSVWEVLSHPRCHYYVCGDSQMAQDVYFELMRAAHIDGGLDHYDAVQFFRKMKKECRFQTDTWGIVENREEVLETFVGNQYNKGAKWLENMEAVKEIASEKT